LEDIQAQFIPWLARKTGFQYRLPTELEWEAATATDYKFYWGAAPVSGVANGSQIFGWPGDNFDDLTAPTGSFPENPLGLLDIHGNVAEWTASCWADERSAASNDTNFDCNRFVVKGGSWRSGAKFLEVKQRQQVQKFQRANDRGFRLVRVSQ
jgi:formylglycine-generating enzyme required for sulfatase activity